MKMKDKLEQFILSNREAFDSERPSFKVWADIEGQLYKKKGIKQIKWAWSIAATIVLILGIALGLLIYPRIYEMQELQAYNKSKDLEGVEYYFKSEVNALLIKLEGDDQIKNLRVELNRIDAQIGTLKTELARAPKKSKEIIYEAIIASYEAKMELLETAVSREKEINIIKDEVQQI